MPNWNQKVGQPGDAGASISSVGGDTPRPTYTYKSPVAPQAGSPAAPKVNAPMRTYTEKPAYVEGRGFDSQKPAPTSFNQSNVKLDPSKDSAGIGMSPETAAYGASLNQPRSIRSATFADGGMSSPVSDTARYQARERQLLAGLPARTSDWERKLEISNAMVGAPGNSYMDSKMTKSQREAAMAQTVGVAQALRDQYQHEDDRYTNAYLDATGRQDTGYQNDLTRGNQRTLQGMQNQGRLELQDLQNQGQLGVTDLQGRDAFNRQALMEGGATERERIGSEAARRESIARFGQAGTGAGVDKGLAHRQMDMAEQDNTDKRNQVLRGQEIDFLSRYTDGDAGRAAEIRDLTPGLEGLTGQDRTRALVKSAGDASTRVFESPTSGAGIGDTALNYLSSLFGDPREVPRATLDNATPESLTRGERLIMRNAPGVNAPEGSHYYRGQDGRQYVQTPPANAALRKALDMVRYPGAGETKAWRFD